MVAFGVVVDRDLLALGCSTAYPCREIVSVATHGVAEFFPARIGAVKSGAGKATSSLHGVVCDGSILKSGVAGCWKVRPKAT